jgi:KipI family sensor histidine kinase inhibitor
MIYPAPRLFPFGDAALLVEFADEIGEAANNRVNILDAALSGSSVSAPRAGIIETVPAYASLLIEYDPLVLSYAELAQHVLERLAEAGEHGWQAGRAQAGAVKEVPVFYGGDDGPDLAELAARQGLAPEEVVRIHSGQLYTVYMLGFSPGFPYLGVVPESIAAPRLSTPRTSVPAGSIGIAGRQTGIYPQATPGGWRLIGRTDLVLFDPQRDPPAYFAPGDRVRFVPVQERGKRPAFRIAAMGPAMAAPLALQAGPSITGPSPVGLSPAALRPAPSASVEVLSPGLLTTVQDLGRHGYQRYGVPVCGPVDEFALWSANALAGNSPGAAGLELTVSGPVLRFHAAMVVALTGADLACRLHSVDLGAWDVPLWTAFFVRAGSLLECRGRRSGCRAYLALAGGVATPLVLGSQATCLSGGFGGYDGRALAAGDWLATGPVAPGRAQLAGRVAPVERRPAYAENPTVRVIPGPQAGYFGDNALQVLLTQPYQVSPTSDRTGLRLAGPPLARAGAPEGGREMISCGMTLGAIQVPAGGRPIVLLADRQTVGGYPVIATVIRADLPLLAQCLPGAGSIRFQAVTVEEAQRLWRAQQAAWEPVRADWTGQAG